MVELVALVFPAFGLVLLAGGVGLVRKGRFYRRQSERVAETAVTDVGSLQPGTVAVEGIARVDEEAGTVTTALTEEEALVSQSTVTAKESRVTRDTQTTSTETIHEEEQMVPFLVEDETGTVPVDPPAEADLRIDENAKTERNRGVPEKSDLADDPDAAGDGTIPVGDTSRYRDRDRRYSQRAIRPGEEVYVLGEATDRADWDGASVEIGGGEHPERFIVSDEGHEAVERGGTIGVYIAYAIGGFLGFIGLLFLLAGTAALLG